VTGRGEIRARDNGYGDRASRRNLHGDPPRSVEVTAQRATDAQREVADADIACSHSTSSRWLTRVAMTWELRPVITYRDRPSSRSAGASIVANTGT
jgi:hypothetical protein